MLRGKADHRHRRGRGLEQGHQGVTGIAGPEFAEGDRDDAGGGARGIVASRAALGIKESSAAVRVARRRVLGRRHDRLGRGGWGNGMLGGGDPPDCAGVVVGDVDCAVGPLSHVYGAADHGVVREVARQEITLGDSTRVIPV